MNPPSTLPIAEEPAQDKAGTPLPPSVTPRLLPMLALVAGLALAFGWPTRHGQFLSGDDQHLITDHVLVNHPSLAHAWDLLTIIHGDLYQPLPMLTFQANYAMAAPAPDSRFGIDPMGFHLTNIALHAINAVLACLLALGLSRRFSIALLVGTMFACHPFALEPVAWISGRMILLATTFALATILLCIHRRREADGISLGLAGLTWILSLLSKVLPTVPIAAVCCDHTRSGKIPRRVWVTYAAFLGIGLGATWFALVAIHRTGFTPTAQTEISTAVPVRILLAGRYYLENYLWPNRLAPWSPPPDHTTWQSPATILALAEACAFAWLLVFTRRRAPLTFLGLSLFAILLAPFLAATATRRLLAADRYMYLPIFGLHLAAAAAAVQLADRVRHGLSKPLWRTVLALPLAAIITAWMLVAWHLAPAWADTVARDRRVLAVYPDSVLAHAEMARAYNFQNMPDQALEVVARARRRWPNHPRLAAQAGQAYRLKHDWLHAESQLRAAAAKMPLHLRTQYDLALTLDRIGKQHEARTLYLRILKENATFLPALTALARNAEKAGDLDAAADWFQKAVAINPFDRNSLLQLALLQIRRGHWPEAEHSLRAILKLDPNDPVAKFHLAVVLLNQGQPYAALEIYNKLLRQDENNVPVLLNRASALAAMGRVQAAERDYQKILALQPGHLQAALCLHELLYKQHRTADILRLWLAFQRHAQRAGPSSAPAAYQAGAYLAWAYALNDQMADAKRLIASIPADAPQRRFADWLLIRDALRRRATAELAALLGKPRIQTKVDTDRRNQARIIAPALTELPAPLRQSTAGRYTLARLFLFDGHIDAALATVRELAQSPRHDRWTQAAQRLRELIEKARAASSQQRSPPESTPH